MKASLLVFIGVVSQTQSFSSLPTRTSSRVRLLQPSHSPLYVSSSSKLEKAATPLVDTDLLKRTHESTTKKIPFPLVVWKFTRPHTLIGSALAIPALHGLAAPTLADALTVPNLVACVYAMVPSLLMNLYITGLNQITDVEIDKINKPNLPIPAGILSKRTATWVVSIALLASLAMGVASPLLGSQGLNVALYGSAILGTMYSLKPFRLKRFPLLAAFCIVAVRGTIINASFFAHAKKTAYGAATGSVLHFLRTDKKCLLSSIFFGVFGIVIALMKDVPDVAGDEMARVRTFSVRIGQKRIFHTMRRLLSGLFGTVGIGFLRSASAAAATTPVTTVMRLSIATLSFLAAWEVNKASRGVDPEDSKQVYAYYIHLWKLFYLSYLFLPFAR
mmetsp:Transcript_27011/g.39502  ORF Transcript_27011/g.39502 Transcript_27011/m.39502 type:complete len:389 (-) Transcript_27011:111-1277(-)